MKRSSLISVIVLALVIISLVFYLAKPRPNEIETAPLGVTPGPAEPGAEPANASSNVVSCAGPINSQIPIAGLDARHKWARSLVQTNHVSGALTELRNIATLDPGYPAINLEISKALLKANRAPEAQDAIKLQIEISDCLANLPQRDTLSYCKSQWVSGSQADCAPELLKINHEAHYEAGLVDADLARNAASRVAVVPASPVIAPPRPRVTPASTAAPATAATTPQEVAAVTAPVELPTAPKPIPPTPVNLKTSEAAEHVGKLAKVCGTVVSKHTAEESNGKPTFVNLDRVFPNQAFTIVVWGTDASAVGDLPATGNVCVTGTVAMYRGVPQIVLHDAQSWSVASSQP